MPSTGVEEYIAAARDQADTWVPASGGSEKPFRTRTGRRLLFCYNPAQREHAYLDCDTDVVLTDDEAYAALGRL